MMTRLPTFSIKFSQQCRTCVLDPTLVLSRYGISLVKQLGELMEIWFPREFWHILDNTHFYLENPEYLFCPRAIPAITIDSQQSIRQEIIQALQQWELRRKETALVDLNIFRVGDKLEESHLPKRITPQIIWDYETLAHSLEKRIENHPDVNETLISAFRDTVALALTLDSSCILTYQLPKERDNNLPPRICMALEQWEIPCQAIALQDEIVTLERNYWHQLFVQAGMSKFLWADNLHMAVLHLLAPANSELDIWKNVQGFWYQL
jgi:hypothetical protein